MTATEKTIKNAITCPYCGHQYIPSEIYTKGELVGGSCNVIKDAIGKILYLDYQTEDAEPQYVEEYICDSCNKPFSIEATLTFKSKPVDEALDFSETSASLLD